MDLLSKLFFIVSIFFYLLLLIDALNNLQNRLLNIKVVQLPKRKQFTLKDVSAHCTENDCWMVVKDLVYDVTEFMREVKFI
jgi:cytochrome b involved in lipid metabolism